jgi:hypothetical protein
LANENRELTLSEILDYGAESFTKTSDYESNGIALIENSPEEIRDVAIEMVERMEGTWQNQENDDILQKLFWDLFPSNLADTKGVPLHGKIYSYFGAQFLRNNRDWLN